MTLEPMSHQVCAWTETNQVCKRATRFSLSTSVKNITLISTSSMNDENIHLKARGTNVAVTLPSRENDVMSIILGAENVDEFGGPGPLVCVQNFTLNEKRIEFMPFAIRSRNSFVTFSENVS